jgi:hypothetical protein
VAHSRRATSAGRQGFAGGEDRSGSAAQDPHPAGDLAGPPRRQRPRGKARSTPAERLRAGTPHRRAGERSATHSPGPQRTPDCPDPTPTWPRLPPRPSRPDTRLLRPPVSSGPPTRASRCRAPGDRLSCPGPAGGAPTLPERELPVSRPLGARRRSTMGATVRHDRVNDRLRVLLQEHRPELAPLPVMGDSAIELRQSRRWLSMVTTAHPRLLPASCTRSLEEPGSGGSTGPELLSLASSLPTLWICLSSRNRSRE